VLTHGAEQRAAGSIDARLHALAAAQTARTDQFVTDLRHQHLALMGIALATLLLVLGYGLHRLVVGPTLRLRIATQRVAAGELDVPLPDATADELGDLTRDFARMLQQLHAARAEQQRLAAGLADQVADKTAHLERALTELRASHRQLAAAERLASLGTLAGGIAHEFHNVIGGIRGCAHELAQAEPDPERRQTLAVITRAADRATGIVQQLARFARRSIDRAGELDPVVVVEDALRLCEPAARRQQVVVERDYASGLRLHGDADGLHQVCVNLLVNALQAMPTGGALHVRVAAAGDHVALEFRDNGVGIAPTHLDHIFEPFFTTRGDAASPEQRGTGLGLSESFGIVQAHKGRIDVRSRPGEGSTFTVRLPVTPPAGR
jgi:two-component system NtrC family sensor kinase